MAYQPLAERYESGMRYNRVRPQRPASCRRSRSGSGTISAATSRTRPGAAICRTAFDLGITHFDLANNYGPPPGSAEAAFGEILRTDFAGLRDELVISTKAGYRMWPGPYGEWGSRKYLLASLDQSLKRMGARLCRHLLFPPLRPRHAARGDDGRARHARCARARRSMSASPPTTRSAPREAVAILRRPRHALHHPPAELFHDQPLDRGRRPARHARRARGSAASPSRRWRRAC